MTKTYQLTVHPNKEMASHGCAYLPTIRVKEQGASDWTFFYTHIEGFEHEEGHQYVIEVEETPREEPIPADCSSVRIKLLRIISDTKVN